eukprot:GEMP01037229.1.p1 GENE.GEMP01037229.1~~GEMP01037229.1.p1  ORF type:complete len:214 (+),score=62.53 GEMP01037229.1:859-1500(+)
MGQEPTLYDILGIERGAAERDVLLAYRQRARELHPDKNPDKGAKEAFQAVQHAYSVLKDLKTRKRYDAGGLDAVDLGTAYDYLREKFPPLQTSDIDAFAQKYRGSGEEREDLISYYTEKKGNLSNLEEEFILCEVEHVPRLLDLVNELIAAKRLKKTAAYTKSAKTLRATPAKKRKAPPPSPAIDLVALIRNKKPRLQAGGVLASLWNVESED